MKIEVKFIIALMAGVVNAATTKTVTTLTYINRGVTFTRTMTPPSSVNTMKLVCLTTSNTNSEYCTEVYDSNQKDIIFDCYKRYNRYRTTIQNDQVNYCYVYTQKYKTFMTTREVCSDYNYVSGKTITSDVLCKTKLARCELPTGYTYTSQTVRGNKVISFPIPEEVTDITVECGVAKNVKPTPFSIINQEITTVDNPDFTATAVKSTKTVVDDVTTRPPNENNNIYMGELVTEDGEITTKIPIAYASLNYCDEDNLDLCYNAYAVTDACTIFTRIPHTKTVPNDILTNIITTTDTITTTIDQSETPDITISDLEYMTITKTKKTTETEKVSNTKTKKTTETEKVSITKSQEKETQSAKNCKNVYEQCGGIGYSGPECCVNSKCVKLGDYYHQCQP